MENVVPTKTNNDDLVLKVLMIGPALDHTTGGIPAVVEGLMKGFICLNDIEVEYSEYCSSMPGIGIMKRIAVVTAKLLAFPFKIKRSSPALVHMHSSIRSRGIFRDIFFLLVIKASGIPLVLELHGGRADSLQGIMKQALSLVIRLSDRIVLTSSDQQMELVSLFPALRNKIHMIPNPLELPEKNVKGREQNAGVGEYPVKIVFASRLIKSKGAAALLFALSRLENNNKWVAEIYGDGPEMDNLRLQSTALGLNGRVALKGNVPLQELLKVYSESDIFVFPSEHLEGFPMALFLAVASGMAIVSSRTAPVPDYLQEADNCFYMDPQDAKGMARAISLLLGDRELRINMGLRNAELSRQFLPERIASSFAELYAGVAEPRQIRR